MKKEKMLKAFLLNHKIKKIKKKKKEKK